MPDHGQIKESPERRQKLQHLHDLMVDRVIKALETEEQPNVSMLRTCLEVLKANDMDVDALALEKPVLGAIASIACSRIQLSGTIAVESA